MANRLDMPTNEGSLALARAVATGAKLSIRGARLCLTNGALGSFEAVANLTWSDMSGTAVIDADIPCTCYLPCMADTSGDDTGKAVAALDIEFGYFAETVVEYDTVAVLADLYYAFAPFIVNATYEVGATVWLLRNDGSYTYHKCKEHIDSATEMPPNDLEHWEEVTPVNKLNPMAPERGGLTYWSLDSEPVLLYVSVASNTIKLSENIELDYKVRLYIDGVSSSSRVGEYVIFDTLGPEFMGSAQLELLAEFATNLRQIRDVAFAKATAG